MLWLQAFLINTVLIALAQRLPLLTRAGWVHAAALGTTLWGVSVGVVGSPSSSTSRPEAW